MIRLPQRNGNAVQYAGAGAKFLQSCLTLSDLMDCSLAGSYIHGIFQARVLEWGCHCFKKEQNT